jgi:hypothetical protein
MEIVITQWRYKAAEGAQQATIAGTLEVRAAALIAKAEELTAFVSQAVREFYLGKEATNDTV